MPCVHLPATTRRRGLGTTEVLSFNFLKGSRSPRSGVRWAKPVKASNSRPVGGRVQFPRHERVVHGKRERSRQKEHRRRMISDTF